MHSVAYKTVDLLLSGKLASGYFAPVDIELRDFVSSRRWDDKFVAVAAVPALFVQQKDKFGSSILGGGGVEDLAH